jgi:uncharacterized protein (DUF736 family)
MIIGKFSYEVTKFTGRIGTLAFETDAIIQQVSKATENSPGFRIVDKGGFERGVAWDELSENNNRYLSCQLNSPAFHAKVYCNLVEGRDGWQLLWNRPKPKAATKVENGKFRDEA